MSICAPASFGDSGLISGFLGPLDPNATPDVLSSPDIQELEL